MTKKMMFSRFVLLVLGSVTLVACAKKTEVTGGGGSTAPVGSTPPPPASCAPTKEIVETYEGFCKDPAIRCVAESGSFDDVRGGEARELEVRLCNNPNPRISKREFYFAEAFTYKLDGTKKIEVSPYLVGNASVLIRDDRSRRGSFSTILTLPGVLASDTNRIYFDTLFDDTADRLDSEASYATLYLESLGKKFRMKCSFAKSVTRD